MAESHTTIENVCIEYPRPSATIGKYLAKIQAAAIDPKCTTNDMIALVYSPDNPVMDSTILPGRGMVTPSVAVDPIYRIMVDLIGRKRVQLGELDLTAAQARYTVPATAAAEQLGLTGAAIRAAAAAGRIPAMNRDGRWWFTEAGLVSYKLSTRGRPAKAKPIHSVIVRIGSQKGVSMSVSIVNGSVVRDSKSAGVIDGHFADGWTEATIRTTSPDGVRIFTIEPSASNDSIGHGDFFVQGAFRITKKVNHSKTASAAWSGARKRESVTGKTKSGTPSPM